MKLPALPSLRSRLLSGTAVLTLSELLLAWWLIAGILERFVAQRFDAEKTAIAQAVMAGAGFDALGQFGIDPTPADPRFERAPGHARTGRRPLPPATHGRLSWPRLAGRTGSRRDLGAQEASIPRAAGQC